MGHRFGHALDRQGIQGVGLGDAAGPAGDDADDMFGPVAHFHRQQRVPPHFFQRFFAPLPPAIDCQRETIALKRLDQHVGDRSLLRVAVEQFSVRGRDDDRRMGMVSLQLSGEPESVVAGHHHVDDRQVAVLFTQRLQRFVGAGGSLGSEAKGCDPSSHQVAYRRFIVDDEDGGQGIHDCCAFVGGKITASPRCTDT